MALVECPECKNQVSDIAEACPKCGFPIYSYFENKRQEEEQRLAEAELEAFLGNRYKSLEKLAQFNIFGHGVSFSENQRIIITIMHTAIQGKKIASNITEYIYINNLKIFDNEDDINSVRPIIQKWVGMTFNPVAHSIAQRIKEILVDGSYYPKSNLILDGFDPRSEEDIINIIFPTDTYYAISNWLLNNYIGYWDSMDLDRTNAISDITSAQTQVRTKPISAVYSSTYTGLAVQSIKASFVNGIASSIQERQIQKDVEKTRHKVLSSLSKLEMEKAAELIGDLNSNVGIVVSEIQDRAIKLLSDIHAIIEDRSINPIDIEGEEELVEMVSEDTKELQVEDKKKIADAIQKWPVLLSAFSDICSYLNLDNTASEIRRIGDYFSCTDELKDLLRMPRFEFDFEPEYFTDDDGNALKELFTDQDAENLKRLCSNYENNLSLMNIEQSEEYLQFKNDLLDIYKQERSYKDKLFDTIKEKHNYIDQEKRDIEYRTVNGVLYSTNLEADDARYAREQTKIILRFMRNKGLNESELVQAKEAIIEYNNKPPHCIDDLIGEFDSLYKANLKKNRTFNGVVYDSYDKRIKAERDYNLIFNDVDVKSINESTEKLIIRRMEQHPDCTEEVKKYAVSIITSYEAECYIIRELGSVDAERAIHDSDYLTDLIRVRESVDQKAGMRIDSRAYRDLNSAIENAKRTHEVASEHKGSAALASAPIALYVIIGLIGIAIDFVFVPSGLFKAIILIVIIGFVISKISEATEKADDIRSKNEEIQRARERIKKNKK